MMITEVDRAHVSLPTLVGLSPPMEDLRNLIQQLGENDSPVLILGESGTGKEVVAQTLHRMSGRRGPFVAVNCGAIPAALLESELFGHERGAFTDAFALRIGRFEQADGGTLFLDEIGELSPSLQVKLLRVLQDQAFERVGGSRTIRVDVRILAASNRDLDDAVLKGRFRTDLYYRLNVIPIQVPPLRARGSDIPLLAEHFIRRLAQRMGIAVDGLSTEAAAVLLRYGWPGNVRELENVIERAAVLKRQGLIEVEDLPPKVIEAPCSSKVCELPLAAGAFGSDRILHQRRWNDRAGSRTGVGEEAPRRNPARFFQMNADSLNARLQVARRQPRFPMHSESVH
jgi:transcriptional regulator with GAF, ATPase, and Fis domain